MSKRAKSESLVKVEEKEEGVSATTVFNSPYLVREIVKWNGAKDFESARFVVKGGLNVMWNSKDKDFRRKFRHETLSMLTEDLDYRIGEEYESIEFLNKAGEVVRTEYAVNSDPTNLRVTEYKMSGESWDATFIHTWAETKLETRDGLQQTLSKRPDGRTDFKEVKKIVSYISFIPDYYERDSDIIDRPFEPKNQTIRPDLWAKYPFTLDNVDDDTLKLK